MQRNDDSGHQIRHIYTGPTGMRWRVNWTFAEWAVAALSLGLALVLLLFIVPSAALAGLGLYWVASQARSTFGSRHFWGVLIVGTLFLLLINHDLGTWLLPVWFPIALLVSVRVPYVVVKRWGRYFDWNRPVAYWLRLPARVAAGPRLRDGAVIDPALLALKADLQKCDTGWNVDHAQPIVIHPPKKGRRSLQRTAPASPVRRRLVARTELGWRVRNTEFRFGERNFQ